MKSEGQVSYAVCDGTYFIKFVGDIRFQVCVTVDRFIQRIFSTPEKPRVVIDLLDTHTMDSTALGVIAQIAVHTRRAHDKRPTVLVRDIHLINLLKAVSFDKVFTILSETEYQPDQLENLENLPYDEREFTHQVLQAHRHLMALSRENHLLFEDVSRMLEQHLTQI